MISQRRDVLAIVVGLLFAVAIALGIVVLVALPNLRQGSRILTPDGERAVQRARQTPLAAAGGTWHGLVALERLIARLGRQIARAWAPVSVRLHEAMDRLEARDAAKDNGSGVEPNPAETGRASGARDGTPIRHAAGTSRPGSDHPAPAEVPEAAETWEPAVGRGAGIEPAARPEAPEAAENAERDVEVAAEAEAVAVRPARKQDRFDVARVIGRSSVGRPRPVPPISGPIPEIGDEQPGPGERTIDLRESERSERSDADREAGSARRAR